ncbi:peptidylprolyl isomerase [Campylobacter sp. MIT 99-7217]|uniref:peptidylprolyl isomerase n=1 Tax=Campylobacter sp. MIT 99-7217 TaxID=535091 RepID=UPI001157FC3B|nr:peptidylprolyl isomerase [Campylobacter sp. MIT 99-7217]TQR31832.1 peptidylprolyl isomerase [Campylobacter sp. MIT 99-7217]
MITWMQKHKKWLVVTIWISVIAFVGAGFVGWGGYDLNINRSSSLAKVGNEKITLFELNERYAQVFSYYNQISNGTLSDELAKERQLDLLALNDLIEDKLFINFAKDLGLSVSENEAAIALASQEEFWDENNTFDQEKYYFLLAQNQIKTSQYEQMLEDRILLRKLRTLFELPVKENEFEMLGASYFMQDVLSIAKLDFKPINVDINETELQNLWKEHEKDYINERRYEISTYFLPIAQNFDEQNLTTYYEENKHKYTDFTGKILSFDEAKKDLLIDFGLKELEKTANQAYLDLNSQKIPFQADLNISENDIYYPLELLDNARANSLLKPFKFKQNDQNGLMIIRLNALVPASVKSFEQAKEEVLPLYLEQKQTEALNQQASKALENFKGKNIGSMSRDSIRDPERVSDDIMNDTEFSLFLMQVFNSNQKKGFVAFKNKAILYEIRDQNLINQNKINQYKESLSANLQVAKANELEAELSKELRKIYKVEIYYKGNLN